MRLLKNVQTELITTVLLYIWIHAYNTQMDGRTNYLTHSYVVNVLHSMSVDGLADSVGVFQHQITEIWDQLPEMGYILYIVGLCHYLCLTHSSSYIYASMNCVTVGSGNRLSPIRRQAINWTKAGLLWIGPQDKFKWNFNRNSIISFTKMRLDLSLCRMVAISSRGRWAKTLNYIYFVIYWFSRREFKYQEVYFIWQMPDDLPLPDFIYT